MRGFALLCLVLLAAIVAGVGIESGGSSALTVSAVSSRYVSQSDSGTLEAIGTGALVLSACNDGYGGGRATSVNPTTLRLVVSRCGAFPPGESVTYAIVLLKSQQAVWDCQPESEGVRAVVQEPSGRAVSGPVIMRFAGECSTTRPIAAYASGSLWLYDCATGGGATTGQIVQVSARTGAVETSLTMASDCHTSFAADDDGAVVASYDDPGPIYFVPNGARRAEVALRTGGRVNWFSGDVGSIYANVGAAGRSCAPSRCGIWQLSGSHATASVLVSTAQADNLVAAPVTGDGALFSLVLVVGESIADMSTSYEVVAIDPTTGAIRDLRELSVGGYYTGPPQLAFVDGALYIYDQPTLFRFTLI